MSKHGSLIIRWLLLSIFFCALSAVWFSHNASAQTPTATPPPVRQLAHQKDFEAQPTDRRSIPAVPTGASTIASVADAEIIQGYPTAGCNTEAEMHVGYDDYLEPDGQITRGLLKFSISAIPAGAIVNSVQLQAYLVESWDYPGSSRTITAYRISSAWLEDRVTWNSAPALAEAYGSASVPHGNWGWYSFNVTSLVNGWRGGQFPNNGIALRGPEHSGNDSSWRAFATGATSYSPRLVVNYSYAGVSESHEIVIPDHATTLSAANYTLTAAPANQRVITKGGAVTYTVSVSPTGGFSGTVTLAVGGVPGSTSFGWSTNPLVLPNDTQPLSSTLTLSTSTNILAGSYPLLITGTSASLTHSVPVTLTVESRVYLPLVFKQKPPVPYNTLFLIIGIADYEHMDPSLGANPRAGSPGYDLVQPLRDKNDMVEILSMLGCSSVVGQVQRPQAAGCPLSNFLVLNDSQATKAAIRNAIVAWLSDRANTDTTIVIFFSGHGSTDGNHEYIAPYDLDCNPCGPTPETTTWDLTTAIRDDELAGWLNQLSSQRVVLLFDSCYSGGMTTAANDMARGLGTYPNNLRSPQAGNLLLSRVTGPGRLALMASAANQASWEFSALKNGVFTYYLVEALLSPGADTNHNGRVSVEEAYAYLAGPVDNYVFARTGEHQNPQISDGISGEVDLTFPVAAPAMCPAW
jgi:hypothetical protein